MNIAVFGSTGRVGKKIVRLALADHHQVTAFVRDRRRADFAGHPNVNVYEGDTRNEYDVERALAGCHLVFSALNSDGGQTLAASTANLIAGMRKHHIRRLVAIGTAGILDSRTTPGAFRCETGESKRGKTKAALDHLAAFRELAASQLDWTIVCPTYLPEGPETGQIRSAVNVLPEGGRKVTTGDTARFAYEIRNDATTFGKRIGLSD